MKNPFGDQQISGSSHNLKERLYKNISTQVNETLLDMIVKAYETALNQENVTLSRPERKQLLSEITKMIMEDMLKKLG